MVMPQSQTKAKPFDTLQQSRAMTGVIDLNVSSYRQVPIAMTIIASVALDDFDEILDAD